MPRGHCSGLRREREVRESGLRHYASAGTAVSASYEKSKDIK